MVDTLEQEISEGLKQNFKEVQVDTTGAEFANVTINETPAAKAEEIKIPEVKAEVKTEIPAPESSLKNDTPVKEEIKKDIVETPPVKSFEEQFAEQTGGKFKNWKEVEDLLNTPKEEMDEEIKHLAELKKGGVKFDREFWELQTRDYESMDDPFEVLLESMKLKDENKGLSEKALMYKLKEQYQYDKWSEDGSEPTEVELIQAEILKRDAERERDALIARQKSLTTIKQPDQAAILEQQKQAKIRQQNWEKFVDEDLVGKVTKLSTVLDETSKEVFEFEIPDVDKKEISNTMKLMTADASVFWNQFLLKDDKGALVKDDAGNTQMDHRKVYEMFAKVKNYDNAIKIASQNALAKGRETEVKEIKNIDFKADSKGAPKGDDWKDKARQQVEKHL